MDIDKPKAPDTPTLEQTETSPETEDTIGEVRDDVALELHTAALLKQSPTVPKVCETSEIREERIFSREEITRLIVSFAMTKKLDMANLKVSKIINDKRGNLLVLEIESPNPNEETYLLISYTIKGRHGRDKSGTTTIDWALLDTDDIPKEAGVVTDYKEGEWDKADYQCEKVGTVATKNNH
jgi:hypothetical protein